MQKIYRPYQLPTLHLTKSGAYVHAAYLIGYLFTDEESREQTEHDLRGWLGIGRDMGWSAGGGRGVCTGKNEPSPWLCNGPFHVGVQIWPKAVTGSM